MAKMTKEQTARFNELFETTMNWGDGVDCIGLFEEFGGMNDNLGTRVFEGGDIDILEFNGEYLMDLFSIPLNNKTKAKATLKKIVEHLANGGSFDTLGLR